MEKGDEFGKDARTVTMRAIKRSAPHLFDFMFSSKADFHSLRFYSRAEGDVLGVLKRFGAEGDVQVVFGSGVTWLDALLNVESSAAADRWRLDKPWNGNNGQEA